MRLRPRTAHEVGGHTVDTQRHGGGEEKDGLAHGHGPMPTPTNAANQDRAARWHLRREGHGQPGGGQQPSGRWPEPVFLSTPPFNRCPKRNAHPEKCTIRRRAQRLSHGGRKDTASTLIELQALFKMFTLTILVCLKSNSVYM